MVCQGCYGVSPAPLCRACYIELRPAADRILPGGIRAISAFEHTGVAARLIHACKYRGAGLAVALAVAELSGRVPSGLTFVPIPRVWSRYLRYGVDPAADFGRAMAGATEGRLWPAIERPIHHPRRAGSRDRPRPGRLISRAESSGRVAVVDDVLTSGSTIAQAVGALLPIETCLVVTMTSARLVSSLIAPDGSGHQRAPEY